MATEGVRQGAPVKLTRPNVDRAWPRQRLFALLDNLLATPVLWLGAPAGSGKTTLLSNYIAHRRLTHLWYRFDVRDTDPASFFARLREAAAAQAGWPVDTLPSFAPEYLPAAEVFTRNFFEALFGALKPPTLIVFDDFHELPQGAGLKALLPSALGSIPEGIHVVILSRAMPPPAFANLRARGGLRLMEAGELNLRLDEAREIARLAQGGRVPDELVTRCHAQTVGWVAGLILLLEYLRDREGTAEVLLPGARETLFDYFATQVLMDIDARTRRLLLLTASMPQVTAEEAVALSALEDAPARLESLARNNFFTTRLLDQTTCYQYHPLFHEFLRTMAGRHLTTAEQADNKARAAAALVARDDLDHAARLLVDIGDWPSLSTLVLHHGARLMAQGRHLELLRWVEAVPLPILSSSPWLLFWKAVASLPVDKEASYAAFARAYEGFLAAGDTRGAVHAWSGAVESLVLADHDPARMEWWRGRLAELRARGGIDEDPLLQATLAPLVVGMCVIRGPRGIDVERWIKAAEWAVAQPIDPSHRILASFALAAYFHVSGQRGRERFVLDTQAAVLEAHTVTPLATLTGCLCRALNASVEGEPAACRAAVEDGYGVALKTGIHHWTFALLEQGLTSALIHGALDEARDYCARLVPFRGAARAFDLAFHTHQLAWMAALEGDAEEALRRQRLAVEQATVLNHPFLMADAWLGLSLALHATGQQGGALEWLARVKVIAEECRTPVLRVRADLLAGFYHLETGREAEARATLVDALERARRKNLRAFLWWIPRVVARVFGFALENGIESEFVCGMIRRYDLRPHGEEPGGMAWPHPLRVRTLGPLVIEVDGEPVVFTGKAQKKPLELLKALVALGGCDVREERLTEHLWPDADGDAAVRNLQTTLHRLRKLLRHDDAIEVSRGVYRLNPHVCRVDVAALEELMGEISRAAGASLEVLARRLLDLCRGSFLAGEAEAGWIHGPRARLQLRMLEGLERLGGSADASGRPDLAIALYTRALALDPTAEEFYLKLILCHGRQGDVDNTLASCRRMNSALGHAPARAANQAARVASAVQAGDMALLQRLVTRGAVSAGGW